jgi:hypothetical protein
MRTAGTGNVVLRATPWLSRLAFAATAALYAIVAAIVLSTPEGDKDSHVHLALVVIVYGSPIAASLAVAAIVHAQRAKFGSRLAVVSVVLALLPFVSTAALLFTPVILDWQWLPLVASGVAAVCIAVVVISGCRRVVRRRRGG